MRLFGRLHRLQKIAFGGRNLKMKNWVLTRFTGIGEYAAAFARWVAVAVITGIIGGLVGVLFHYSVDHATELRAENPWIIWFMPLGGVLIVFLYKITKMMQNGGTNNVIKSAADKERVPWRLAPLIFISTVITHLVGGSSGREGAALQLGGSIGEQVAKIFRKREAGRKVIVMCGMASVFSALFGTPVTAAVFALEVVNVGVMQYSGLVPCMLSSVTAFWVACLCRVEPVRFGVSIPNFAVDTTGKVIVLAILGALCSILFCVVIKSIGRLMKAKIKNDYIRAVTGGFMIIALTFIVGNQSYNGAGMDIVAKALGGNARWFDFLLKLIFTAITLGAGFKGGEIVPTFFVGATFGCVMGSVLGIDAGFAAAIGMVALFCGVVNCPIASCLLAVELFGGEGIIYFALISVISYMLSGYYGLYSSQHFEFSKLIPERADRMAK